MFSNSSLDYKFLLQKPSNSWKTSLLAAVPKTKNDVETVIINCDAYSDVCIMCLLLLFSGVFTPWHDLINKIFKDLTIVQKGILC